MFPNCTDVAIYPFQGRSLEGRGKWRKQPRTMDQLFVAPHLSIQEGFLFWGVIFQRADMHQREVVRENIQGRLVVLLPPSRAGSHSSDSQQFGAGHLQLHAHSSHSGGPGGTISDHAWRHTKGLVVWATPLSERSASSPSPLTRQREQSLCTMPGKEAR